MSDLERLFYWRGIADEYQNYRGEQVKVPLENRLNLLETMGVNISSAEEVSREAYELDVGPWRHFFPALQTCVLCPQDGITVASFYVNLHPERLSQELQWCLRDDDGVVVDSGAVRPDKVAEIGDYLFDKHRYSRRLIPTNTSCPGYYRLELTFGSGDGTRVVSSVLAVCPCSVYQPDWLQSLDKPWGFIVQLYTLRSGTDWGIGDFSDLEQLIRKSAKLGVDLIGLNPLHALLPDVENHSSPYSPSDRRFINPLYIDPTIEPEYESSTVLHRDEVASERNRALEELRQNNLVNYTRVKDIKYAVFEKMFEQFSLHEKANRSGRYLDFLAFVEESGAALTQFALFELSFNRWDGAIYRANLDQALLSASADSLEQRSILDEHAVGIEFHCYLQWLSHVQLERCQRVAIEQGMKVGLVRDLAVGADGGGAEARANPSQFCRGASVGAPPDPLAEQGQNWGLPPLDPAHLRATGYSHFIAVLRENMSRCGALRIDHAMSLMRLWWCPPGTTADLGAYVYYPFEDMLALLCLESHLNSCAIIGEDLGVVPTEFRAAITKAGVFTNRVFYFEKENYHSFKPPENYDVHALAMVNNHDVPTLKSWWDGSDLILRDRLGIFEQGVDYAAMYGQRQRDKQEVFNFLESQNKLPEAWSDRQTDRKADQTLIFSLLAAVSRVSSRLFVIQLEDCLLMEDPVNVPGTYQEHANWQRKISKTLEAIFSSEEILVLLQIINDERRAC